MSTEPLNPKDTIYMPWTFTTPDGQEFTITPGLGGIPYVEKGNRRVAVPELWAAWDREQAPSGEDS